MIKQLKGLNKNFKALLEIECEDIRQIGEKN